MDLQTYLSLNSIREHRSYVLNWYNEHTILAILAFWFFYIIATIFSLPGAVWITIIYGAIIGTYSSLLIVISAATIGSLLVFILARYFISGLLSAAIKRYIAAMEENLKGDAFWYLLFLRLVPIFPFWLVNLAPAFFGVPIRIYLFSTLIGIIPGTYIFCSFGGSLGKLFEVEEISISQIVFESKLLIPLFGVSLLSLAPILVKRLNGSQHKYSLVSIKKNLLELKKNFKNES